MNRKQNRLYTDILQELEQEFQRTGSLGMEISRSISAKKDSEHYSPEIVLNRLELKYQSQTAFLLHALGMLYRGRIERFHVPENSDRLQRMEICGRRIGEIGRVLKLLHKTQPERSGQIKIIEKSEISSKKLSERISDKSPLCAEQKLFVPRIFVCGSDGAGRTSLIQTLINQKDSSACRKTPDGMDIYKSRAADFFECGTPADLQTSALFRSESPADVVWCCIDGSDENAVGSAAELVRQFGKNFLLVITKSELMNKEQTETVMNSLSDIFIPDQIVTVSAENRTGLDRLISKTGDMVSASMKLKGVPSEHFRRRWKSHFSAIQKLWRGNSCDDADCYIGWAAERAAGNGAASRSFDVGDARALIFKIGALYGSAVNDRFVSKVIEYSINRFCSDFQKLPLAAETASAVIRTAGKTAKIYFSSDMDISGFEKTSIDITIK